MRRSALLCLAVSSLSIAVAFPAMAEDAGKTPLSDVFACTGIQDDAARLACYDAQVTKLQGQEAKGEVVAVDHKQVENLQREAFGFSLPSIPKIKVPGLGGLFGGDKHNDIALSADVEADAKSAQGAVLGTDGKGEITKVGYAISRIGSTSDGGYRFYLENGQVWDQVSGGRSYIPKPRKGRIMVAEIRKASMGSYLLTVNGRGKAIRVQRVK